MSVWVVVEFGCNSSYNDMYPPKVAVFKEESKEEATALYQKRKAEFLRWKGISGIQYKIYNHENGETIIQEGGDAGAKRPEGASIFFKKVE